MASKTVMISLGDDHLVMLEKTETFCSRNEFSFSCVRDFELILFAAGCYINSTYVDVGLLYFQSSMANTPRYYP